MKATGKPFLVVVNTREPSSDEAQSVREYLHSEFGVDAVVADCQALDGAGIGELLGKLLYAFPVRELRVHLPRWMDALEQDHPVKAAVYSALLEKGEKVARLSEAEAYLAQLEEVEAVQEVSIRSIEPGSGTVICVLRFPEELFYEILSAKTEIPIATDGELMEVLISLSQIKQKYDGIADALAAVQATGYGVVMPTAEQMKLETPEIVRKGGSYGVKLKASAPSIHMIRVGIDTEISPMVGDEKQSRDLVDHLTGESAENLWQSNIFGKSVYELIREGLNAKLVGLPEEVRGKLRGSLTRIVNEGANGLICLIL
jgi:stage IV sporulation protein A